MAKRKFDSDVNIPIVDDIKSSEFSAIKDDDAHEWDAEPAVGDGDTTVFGAMEDDEALFELARTSSAAHASACRKLLWFNLHNTHLIVYCIFAAVLIVFSVYYAFFEKSALLASFSGVGALFMMYVIVRGHDLFVSGMAFDEEKADGVMTCRFYQKEVCVECGNDRRVIEYNSITSMHMSKNCIMLRIKGSKDADVLFLEKPSDADNTEELLQLIKTKSNIQ